MEDKIKVGGVDAGDPYGLKFFAAVSQMQAELATLRAEVDSLREALRAVVFTGGKKVFYEEGYKTYDPISIAREALK